ncbi:MAG TPA: carboxymuconolactone decarboxylase family protein [Xanthobacteraceae bacterium]|nr:carboxymuconolactone decarboxylase family protein [Xanthobacteraceae bacterium]
MNAPVKTAKRLDPLPPEHSPELKEQFDSFFKSLGFVPNSVLTMQRKPKLVKAFVAMQGAIWDPESKVDRGLKRLIAHVASRAAQDEYSMAHTASGALHFGVEEKKLLNAWNYSDSPFYSEAEKAALDLAVAAGSVPNKVSDELFATLRKHWSEEQIVEILAAVAMAGFLARWNTTMATPLEAEPLEVGEKYLAPRGWKAAAHRR